jgi:nitrite reductase (NADH) small subunit
MLAPARTRYDSPMSEDDALWRDVGTTAQLAPGDVVAITVDGIEMVLGRDGDRYFATQRRCLHRGGDLADGIIARGHLVCAQHGWRFSTATGRHDTSSEFCLARFEVRVANGQIEVDPRPLPGAGGAGASQGTAGGDDAGNQGSERGQ